MKILSSAAILMLLATPVVAQSPDATTPSPQTPSAEDLTRSLNAGPPFVTPARAPVPVSTPGPAPVAIPTPSPAATAAPVPATLSAPAPTMTQIPAPVPRASPAPAAGPAATGITAAPNPTPPPAATAAPVGATVSSPAPAMIPPPPSPATPAAPAAPAYRALDAAARAALPFRLDLPEGFDLDTGRPGPDFTIYSVRRGTTPFVMIYAGPASQFPIYDGQLAEVAGRASVVVTEADGRHAMEHLFQRATAPREIHVWVASLEGTDRALAERIAQSVDVR